MKELMEIQNELNVPKGQYNSFGKYRYRSCEDILEAVKPLLKEKGCQLRLTDKLEYIGDRYYIKATACIANSEGEYCTTEAYAREAESKKGMDESQITGTASSYARKYALAGLFLLDDQKDADTDEYTEKQQVPEKAPEKDELRASVIALAKSMGISVADLAKEYKLNESTTTAQFADVLEDLKQKAGVN